MFLSRLSITALAALLTSSVALAQRGPDLGVVATPEQITDWDRSIGPDGTNLPPGSGTPDAGAAIFAAKCAACHGVEGEGTVNDRLVGGQGTIGTDRPIKTVGSYWPYATTIFDYVRRAMPYLTPHTLTDDEAYALTAHLLHANGIIGPDDVIDAQTLPAIEMPNRDNFVSAYSED
jgi:cytochrome c